MHPIFLGSTGLHVFLVEHEVLEVRGGVEVDYEGAGVGAAGGVLLSIPSEKWPFRLSLNNAST